MDLQGGTSNLQGGGNIQIGGIAPQPQPSQTPQLQPAVNPMSYTSIGTQPQTLAYQTTNTAPAPAPAPTYTDTAGNTYGSQAAADQANANLVAIGIAQGALGAIPGSLAAAQANIQNQYGQSQRSLATDEANAKTANDLGNTQNQQQYRTGQNTVNQQASQDKGSLLRILAGLGAGGGSEAQYLVPDLVGNVASKGLGAAADTFGQNAQNLATNYGNFKNQDQTEQANLANWLTQQNQGAQSQADQSKISLLNTIASLQPNLSQANPYISQINDLSSQVNSLAKLNPQYAGSLPQYVAPSLSSFTPQGNQPVQIANQASAPGTTPFLSLLTGQQDKKQLTT